MVRVRIHVSQKLVDVNVVAEGVAGNGKSFSALRRISTFFDLPWIENEELLREFSRQRLRARSSLLYVSIASTRARILRPSFRFSIQPPVAFLQDPGSLFFTF